MTVTDSVRHCKLFYYDEARGAETCMLHIYMTHVYKCVRASVHACRCMHSCMKWHACLVIYLKSSLVALEFQFFAQHILCVMKFILAMYASRSVDDNVMHTNGIASRPHLHTVHMNCMMYLYMLVRNINTYVHAQTCLLHACMHTNVWHAHTLLHTHVFFSIQSLLSRSSLLVFHKIYSMLHDAVYPCMQLCIANCENLWRCFLISAYRREHVWLMSRLRQCSLNSTSLNWV